MAEHLLVGDFTLNSKSFEGLAGYKVYTLVNIIPKSTMEIRINNQLKAIIQKSSVQTKSGNKLQQYHLYLNKDASKEEQGEWLNLFILYKIGYEFGQDFL